MYLLFFCESVHHVSSPFMKSSKKSFSDIHLSDVKNVSLFPAKLETSFSKRNLEVLPKTASVESVLSGEKENSQEREKGSHVRLF